MSYYKSIENSFNTPLGPLVVKGGDILTLTPGKTYSYSSIDIQSGGVLQLSNFSGGWTLFSSSTNINIDGSIYAVNGAYSPTYYLFQVSDPADVEIGVAYTNNTQTFVSVNLVGSDLVCLGSGIPLASGSLVPSSGTTVSYTSVQLNSNVFAVKVPAINGVSTIENLSYVTTQSQGGNGGNSQFIGGYGNYGNGGGGGGYGDGVDASIDRGGDGSINTERQSGGAGALVYSSGGGLGLNSSGNPAGELAYGAGGGGGSRGIHGTGVYFNAAGNITGSGVIIVGAGDINGTPYSPPNFSGGLGGNGGTGNNSGGWGGGGGGSGAGGSAGKIVIRYKGTISTSLQYLTSGGAGGGSSSGGSGDPDAGGLGQSGNSGATGASGPAPDILQLS